jgi:Tol biopolymer transport system component
MIVGIEPGHGAADADVAYIDKVDPATGSTSRTSDPIDGTVDLLSVSQDGAHAVVRSEPAYPAPLSQEVYAVDLLSGQTQRLGTYGLGEVAAVAISNDGQLIAALTRSALFVARWDTAMRLNRVAEASADSDLSALAWSPDGTWVAFTNRGFSPFGRQKLVLVHPDGGSRHDWTIGTRTDIAWSPDGSRLAFSNGSGSSNAAIDGSDARDLTFTPVGTAQEALAWSPLGDGVGFASGDDPNHMSACLMTASGALRQLSTCTGEYGNADNSVEWSPDGAEVLLPCWAGETPQLAIVKISGETPPRTMPYLWGARWVVQH